jgi:hypothetical protein
VLPDLARGVDGTPAQDRLRVVPLPLLPPPDQRPNSRRTCATLVPPYGTTTERGDRRTTEGHQNWIVVGNLLLFLPPGERCHYKIGTILQVVFVEQDGRNDVTSIAPALVQRL